MNTNRLYALLRKLAKGEGLSEDETTELSNEVFNMAGINVIERVGARLDAMQAKLDMIAETNQATRWLLGIGMTIIGLLVAYGTFFGG